MPVDEYPHYIEFRNVYKTFDHPVLVDVNFHVDGGQTLAIIGRSGVGKSVTLSHIMGFLKPDRGDVIVAHTEVTNMTETELRAIRKKVTMVFQSGALFDSMTVGENILFSLELRKDYNEQNKEDVVDGLLNMVDLQGVKNSLPADLSTGYKRAVAIARALAAQPECILYDEPTTMVDPIMSDDLGNLMLRLKRQLGLTGIVVTHDLDLMRKVADTVVFLYKGEAIYFGPVARIRTCSSFLRWTGWRFPGPSRRLEAGGVLTLGAGETALQLVPFARKPARAAAGFVLKLVGV
jgi:phospholipid/cholesterol/gamma-HCH transport system ATP-binding protein